MPISPDDCTKALSYAVLVLKETATRLKYLNDEAEVFLAGNDAEGYRKKIRERAQLLVDLPERLSSEALEGLDQDTKQKILLFVTYAATSARVALNSGSDFQIGVLLTHPGDRLYEPNDLERLIMELGG